MLRVQAFLQDHIKSRSESKPHDDSNLQLLCRHYNITKEFEIMDKLKAKFKIKVQTARKFFGRA